MSTIEVTPADREAARALYNALGVLTVSERSMRSIMEQSIVEHIFAAHRIASESDLHRKLDVAREALDFYANEKAYDTGCGCCMAWEPETNPAAEGGAIARAALATINGDSA